MSKNLPVSLSDKLLVLETALCLIFVRLLIRFVPYTYWAKRMGIQRQGEPTSHRPLAPESEEQAIRIRRVLAFTIHRLPGKTRRFSCLTQALAGKWMLTRRGIPTTIYIGVGRVDQAITDGFRIHAHAWLHSGDMIVTGGDPLARNLHEIARFGSLDG